MAVGHRPGSAVPGTIVPLAFPARLRVKVRIGLTTRRNRLLGPELVRIKQVLPQPGQVLLRDCVGEVRIKAHGRFSIRQLFSNRVDILTSLPSCGPSSATRHRIRSRSRATSLVRVSLLHKQLFTTVFSSIILTFSPRKDCLTRLGCQLYSTDCSEISLPPCSTVQVNPGLSSWS